MKKKTIAILGAGGRGRGFAEHIRNEGFHGDVVAVAEPRQDYRNDFCATHSIDPNMAFTDWQSFVDGPRRCDAVVISTMDRDHVEPAVACLDKGYDMLLEKPMAVTLADCQAIEAAQRRSGAVVGVCHSLRYNKGFRKVKQLISDGVIGRLLSLDQIEPVGAWHQAHSFVRGNWGNEKKSTFMLLAKSCHDIDYLAYLAEKPCRRVSSFGALSFFRSENAPQGAPERCTDGCPVERDCPYSALKAYVHTDRTLWPANVVSLEHDLESHRKAIETGPYGRCVYRCDNDVVDHQVVNMEFGGDITATFTMTAFGTGGRRVRAHGTLGEIEFGEDRITIRDFSERNTTEIAIASETGGHGGGDNRIVSEWLAALHSRDDSRIVANAQESLRTHTIVFAAEKSRTEKRMVEIEEMTG